jgi:L-alanine-DL-glutamate epimerase-like enolase superfamily enzyme
MMKLTLKPYSYEYNTPFQISRERRTKQDALLVGLSLDHSTGWGELTANSFYSVFCATAQEQIIDKQSLIEETKLEHPVSMYEKWLQLFPDQPFIRCALDEACWDLYGRINQKKTFQLIKSSDRIKNPSCFTLGIDDISKVIDGILAKPWPIYKLKMGKSNPVELLQEIREITNAQIFIDANAAWNIQEALRIIPQLAQLGISMVEQPLALESEQDMIQLKDRLNTPLIADESFNDVKDLNKCADLYDGINIKLQKIGGITPAISTIKQAQTMGLKVMIGCMTESSIGLSAAAQLASHADFIDLDSMLLINNDPALGVTLHQGKVELADEYGNGVVVDSSIKI